LCNTGWSVILKHFNKALFHKIWSFYGFPISRTLEACYQWNAT